jgi:hypothetical protein
MGMSPVTQPSHRGKAQAEDHKDQPKGRLITSNVQAVSPMATQAIPFTSSSRPPYPHAQAPASSRPYFIEGLLDATYFLKAEQVHLWQVIVDPISKLSQVQRGIDAVAAHHILKSVGE